jgi:predicted transcriptional regulator
MAGKRRPPTPITDDIRRQVHDMRADQMTQGVIAKSLGIATSAVSRILSTPRPAD